jgi:hypothetical protein
MPELWAITGKTWVNVAFTRSGLEVMGVGAEDL